MEPICRLQSVCTPELSKNAMKKFLIIIVVFAICLYGCNTKSVNPTSLYSPIALEITTNWGISAIDYTVFSAQNIKIAIIDQIDDIYSRNVFYHSVVENTNVSTQHGSYVLAILQEMVPTADFLAINVASDDGVIEPSSVAQGIEYAINSGCNIINISLGNQIDYPEVESQIAKAVDARCIVVAACGNNSKNELDFPANYNNVISVMARNIDNIDFENNNTSNVKKSISAPGSIIFNESETVVGSSIATAYVTAEIAYVLSIKPDITVHKLQELLVNSSIFATQYSYGMINHKLLTQNLQEG